MRYRKGHPVRSSSDGNKSSCISKLLRNQKLLLILAALFCFGSFSLFPILVLEGMRTNEQQQHVGPNNLVITPDNTNKQQIRRDQQQSKDDNINGGNNNENNDGKTTTRTTKDGRILPVLTLQDLDVTLDNHVQDMPVGRGVAAADGEAINGAERAHIDCDINVDTMAYWNDPIGTRDLDFKSPFSVNIHEEEKFISFAPDRGGWNNVRMSMEIIFVIAAATGRTLILPPKEPLYLLHHDTADKYRGFADFFPIHTATFQQRVRVISFDEYLQKIENNDELKPSAQYYEAVHNAADHCDKRKKSISNCQAVFDYLKDVGHTAEISAKDSCVIFDENKYNDIDAELADDVQEYLDTICGPKRKQFFWDNELNNYQLIHFRASENEYRLLTHFYGMIHFTNPAIDHYYKRFVRDFLHYHDTIYCAAGKIVKAVQYEGIQRGFHIDHEGAGAYSALHVRRGDLQYKKVKISAQEWYDNTKEVWENNEILYVATDERDKSFFDDLAEHHDLRFLDDYWDLAGLSELDPNYMGMIDTIVASRGRAFAGTWFSTFSGYINRLRGYHGMSMMDSWYSFLPKKTAVHEWNIVDDFAYAFEWPDGWIGIDADVFPSKDKF